MRTTFHLASGSIGRISACFVLAALAGCSASGSGPTSSNGNGGQTNNSSNGGQTNSSSGGSSQNTGNGGTSSNNPQGGSNTNNPQGGSNTNNPQGGSSTNNPQGGTTSSSNGGSNAGGSTAGAGPVMCTNTDKSIIPINSDGWVDKACNTCGIQGAFYWYADANTTKSLMCNGAACAANKPPYQTGTPGPGMCISGTATGSKDDWGAGIGLSFNDSGGMNSVKGVFDATKAACGNITGFDITLTGNTNGMPIRVGFKTAESEKAITPFIPVGDPGGMALNLSGSTNIVIKNAAIPADWKSTDPSPSDPAHLYDMQIAVATDSATAGKAFQFCITSVKPVIDGGSGGGGGGTGCKTNSVGTIISNLDIGSLGSNYGYQNNVNNLGSGSQSVTGAYGASCASMTVNTTNIVSNNNAPASYPSIINGWHYGKWVGAYQKANAKAISALTSVKSDYTYTPPEGQKWNVSYDMWVAQSKDISAPESNTLEVMVWLDYSTASTTNPIGSPLQGTFSAGGASWEVWYGTTGSPTWHTVTYRRSPSTAPVTGFDLLPFLKDAVTRGTGSTSWNLLSVQAGFELFNATKGGSVDSYSCTIN